MSRYCNPCIYSTRCGAYTICDYLRITGNKRPCKPGKECTERKIGDRFHRRVAPIPQKPSEQKEPYIPITKINYDAVLELRNEGMNDVEIAKELGCSKSSIQKWRHRNGLPPVQVGRREK